MAAADLDDFSSIARRRSVNVFFNAGEVNVLPVLAKMYMYYVVTSVRYSNIYVYIYIYIYVCVCVCVGVWSI